jgi:hypothetical protein
MQAREAIRATLALFSKPGAWVRGTYSKTRYLKGKPKCSYCMVGGVNHVMGRSPSASDNTAAHKLVLAAIRKEAPEAGSIPAWNDAKGRKVGDILRVLRRASRMAKAAA